MFKAGDRVRVLRHRNFMGYDLTSPTYGLQPGQIVMLKYQDGDLNGDGFVMFRIEDVGDGWSWLIRSDDIELVNDGPVRTVTRREIVPGVYGRVVLDGASNGTAKLTFNYKTVPPEFTAEELREAAHVLNQIAEALEDA